LRHFDRPAQLPKNGPLKRGYNTKWLPVTSGEASQFSQSQATSYKFGIDF